jgi:multidrug efflux system outer membrane protein
VSRSTWQTVRRCKIARPATRGGMCVLAAGLLAGCDLAPRYLRPQYILPANYAGTGPFKVAQPANGLPRGPWWEMFGNATLNTLEAQAHAANPTLLSLVEAYNQTRDQAAEARAGLFPQISASADTSYNRRSANELFRSSGATAASGGLSEEASNEWAATASWEPDFWSRIRNQTRERKQLAQASAATLADARLALQAELANDYMALRGLDAQDNVYRQAVGFYEQAVEITTMRLNAKISAALDVERSKDQLAATQALAFAAEANRGVLEHTIAALTGANPSTFVLPQTDKLVVALPNIPTSVPSQLLQRRPDIASAERKMAAANSAIGVSRAAFYPDINISLTGGFQDSGFNLASLPNSLWTVGATAMLPLFEGGLRRAELDRAWGAFAQTRDTYRATVLNAFRDVENGLTLGDKLAHERDRELEAVAAALQTQTMTLQLYTGGLTNYLDAVVAQEAALTAQITEVQVHTSELQAAVNLVAALGGNWSNKDLPTEDGILPFNPLSVTGVDHTSHVAAPSDGALVPLTASR